MAITVNHSTPADSSFSATGATAWNANHSLVGVGTMAEQNANNVAITGGSITGVSGLGTVTAVTGTAPVVSSGGNTPAISMPVATGSIDGYLSATDWTTFNNKQPAGAYLTAITADTPLSGSGTSASHLSIAQANTTTNGYLSSTDWNTFNGKQPAGTYVNSVSGASGRITSTGGTTPVIDLASGVATAGTTGSSTLIPVVTIDTYGRVTSITTASNPQGTVTSVTGTSPVVSSGGTTPAISMPAATGSVNGYLTSTDWTTFNNKGSGTVTSVGGTGTVNGITLTGTVTTSGNLTLGGTLDLSSPPVIGGTTPADITGTIVTANTKFVSENYYAQSILGGNLRTSGGTSLLNWDGGGSGVITINGGLSANPANKNISLAPTGTGSVTVNPATTGAMNNMVIGGTTPLAGTFTSLTATSGLGGGAF